MKYKLSMYRPFNPICYTCDRVITRNEPAYTSDPRRKFCASCGKMENDYDNKGMERPVK